MAMHIAASSPLAIDKNGIKKEVIDKEEEIIKAEIKTLEKKERWQRKYLKGKLINLFQTTHF